MSDLSPADPVELRRVLAQALMRRRDGRRTQDRAEVAAIAAAEHLAEALRLAGLVVMQAPPAPAHSGTVPAHSLLDK
jgi:hypothetical protein